MRISISLLAATTLTLGSIGCSGPEQKLGRGLNNLTEFVRLGEIRRSMEQTSLYDGTDITYTTGVIRGFNRSVARTAIGLWEVVTFPVPSYDPILAPKGPLWPDHSIRTYTEPWGGLALPVHPVYPDSYKPGLIEDQIFS